MKDQFVTYEIAKNLKELGFDEPCLYSFGIDCPNIGHDLSHTDDFSWIRNSQILYGYCAPLWQQAIEWLKTKNILVCERVNFNWCIYLDGIEERLNMSLERAISKALELIG